MDGWMDFLVFINTDYWPKMTTTLSFLAIWYLIGLISVLSGKRGGWGLAVRVVNNSGCWRDQHGPRSSSSFIITGDHFFTERRVKGLITHTLAPHCVDTSSVASHTNRERHSVSSWFQRSEDICLANIDCDKQLSNHLPRFILRGLSLVVSTQCTHSGRTGLYVWRFPLFCSDGCCQQPPHLSANPQLSLCFIIQPSQDHFLCIVGNFMPPT